LSVTKNVTNVTENVTENVTHRGEERGGVGSFLPHPSKRRQDKTRKESGTPCKPPFARGADIPRGSFLGFFLLATGSVSSGKGVAYTYPVIYSIGLPVEITVEAPISRGPKSNPFLKRPEPKTTPTEANHTLCALEPVKNPATADEPLWPMYEGFMDNMGECLRYTMGGFD